MIEENVIPFPVISIQDVVDPKLKQEEILLNYGIITEDDRELIIASEFIDLVREYYNKSEGNPVDSQVNLAFVIINDILERPILSYRFYNDANEISRLGKYASGWIEVCLRDLEIDENTPMSPQRAEVIRLLRKRTTTVPGSVLSSTTSNYGTRGGSRRSSNN